MLEFVPGCLYSLAQNDRTIHPHFEETDIALNSELSISVKRYVKDYFKRVHDIDSDTKSLKLVSTLSPNPALTWLVYKFVLDSTSTEAQKFMHLYQECDSTESIDLWEDVKKYLCDAIKEEFGVPVEFLLHTWDIGSVIIRIGVRKKHGQWTDDEQRLLTELFNACDGLRVNEHVYIESVSPIAPGIPRIVCYQFQMMCSATAAESVSNIWEKLVNISTEEVFMKLFGKKIHSYFYKNQNFGPS